MKKRYIILPAIIIFLFFTVFFDNYFGKQEANLFAGDNNGKWYRGNVHTHTTNSDGDSSPQDVVRWYKNNGYNFLVLSDHNSLTETEALDTDKNDNFILIPGEEITSKQSLHLNALGIKEVITAAAGSNKIEVIQNNINNTRKAGGIPIINHPNFHWAVSGEIIKNTKNCFLFELYNGHPGVNNFGGGGFPGTEEMWDDILSSGKKIYGIASDDAHHFKKEFRHNRANPGRGWICVKAKTLTSENILNAVEKGNFYSSTGIELQDIVTGNNTIEISITPQGDFKYTVIFTGNNGKILKTSYNNPAVYKITGSEKYVRAKILSSGGNTAWTQPVFLTGF